MESGYTATSEPHGEDHEKPGVDIVVPFRLTNRRLGELGVSVHPSTKFPSPLMLENEMAQMQVDALLLRFRRRDHKPWLGLAIQLQAYCKNLENHLPPEDIAPTLKSKIDNLYNLLPRE